MKSMRPSAVSYTWGHRNFKQSTRFGAVWLECCLVEKDLGVVVNKS